jgi:type IV secretion system protein VirB6
MFEWVGSRFDEILDSYVLDVVRALMEAIAPVALAGLSLWVLLFGWAVLRGEVGETVPAFLWKVTKVGLVLAFALQSGVYVSQVAESANALALGVATTFLPEGSEPGLVGSAYAMLDAFNDRAGAQVADIMKEASVLRLDLLLAGVVFSFGSVVFLCIALFVVTLSKLMLTFVIAVGPLFVLCLAWHPTARFFDSWLSMLLNAVVLTWFAFFALGLSTTMGASIFDAIDAGGGFLGPAFNVLGEATRYCVLMMLMAILCFQAPTLAAGLTGGAVVQQGMHMLHSVLMVAGVRSAARSAAPAAGGAGGVIRAGTGLPYAAGRAAGQLLRRGGGRR